MLYHPSDTRASLDGYEGSLTAEQEVSVIRRYATRVDRTSEAHRVDGNRLDLNNIRTGKY